MAANPNKNSRGPVSSSEAYWRRVQTQACCCALGSEEDLMGQWERGEMLVCGRYSPPETVEVFGGRDIATGPSHCTTGGCADMMAWADMPEAGSTSNAVHMMGRVPCPLYRAHHPVIEEII